MRDLKNPRWIYLKAALFLAIGFISSGLILAEYWHLKTALLLGLTIWSFSRAYYFAFYVIERYIDPTFKFAGICSAVTHIAQNLAPPKNPSNRTQNSLEKIDQA